MTSYELFDEDVVLAKLHSAMFRSLELDARAVGGSAEQSLKLDRGLLSLATANLRACKHGILG